ncbi:MAG: glycoside hydrolase family 38 C-terminal domain-containing protein [bacterium]
MIATISLFFAIFGFAVMTRAAESGAPQIKKAKKNAFIIPHFHYDPVWLISQSGETMRAFSIMHQVQEVADSNKRFKYVFSEMDYVKPYWDAYPARRAGMLDMLSAGRAEFTGGYSEPDESSVGGEALIRNFVYGKIYKEAQFNTKVDTVAQHDVFGHTVQMPQILLKSGYINAQFQRGNETDMPRDFMWLGPDGSSILSKLQAYGGGGGDTALAGDSSNYSLTRNAIFMSGGDFTPPDRNLNAYLKNTKTLVVGIGLHKDYFAAVRAELAERKTVAPEVSRDHTPLLVGCYSSRVDTKLANRWTETSLVDAEKFASIATRYGARYPYAALDKAWRLLLFGQHHDGLTGSDSENVNLDLLTGWREAADLAATVREGSFKLIANGIDTKTKAPKGATPVVLFNGLNWDRTEPVWLSAQLPGAVKGFRLVDSNGKDVPFQLTGDTSVLYRTAAILFVATVPSLGYSTYYIVPAAKMPAGVVAKRKSALSAENEYFIVKVDPKRGGGISALYGKKEKKQYIDSSVSVGNEIYAVKENANKVEGPWSIHATGQVWRSGDHAAEKVWVETGPVATRIVVEAAPVRDKVKIYDGNDVVAETKEQEVLCRRMQEIILYKNVRRIDFRTHLLDYKETDFMYKVGFPASVKGALPVFDERLASVGRDKNTEEFMFYDFWREPGVKRGREYPAYMWMDFTSPARIEFEDAAGGVSVSFPLAIGEIVIPKGSEGQTLANKLAAAFIRKGVTTTPTEDKKPRTNEYYGFRVSLGAGNNAYNKKALEAASTDAQAAFNKRLETDGYAFMFTQPADSVTSTVDHKFIPVLIVEAKDFEKLSQAVAVMAEQLETVGNLRFAESVNAAGVSGKIEPFGLAILNRGHTGHSVENDDTLTMTLMRSSTGWPSGTLYSRNLEVENWNHVYEYGIYPHAGDWRAAKTYKAGWEYNHQIYSFVTGQHAGTLPARNSFLSTAGADAVVIAIKPAGFPYIDGKPVDSGKAPGTFAVRFYDPTGFKSNGEMKFFAPIGEAAEADMLERKGASAALTADGFGFALNPFSIDTYLLRTNDKPAAPTTVIGPEWEKLGPVFTRYWVTNQNVAPMQFMPFTVVAEPGIIDAGKSEMTVKVTVANNLDVPADGILKIIAPGGVKANPAEVKLSLEASGSRKIYEQEIKLTGIDAKKLASQYVTARFITVGSAIEDVLTFSNWQVFRGEAAGAEKADFNDSAWETLPLARFWSQGVNEPVMWYRSRFVIPKGINAKPMFFDRLSGADISVYINGDRVQKSADGYYISPLIESGKIKYGEENVIAVRLGNPKGGSGMYGTAFEGSETLFNNDVWKLETTQVRVKRGSRASIKASFRNPYDQEISALAVISSPIETWPEGGPHSLIQIGPSAVELHAAPRAETPVVFDVSVPANADAGRHIAVVKFVYAGIAAYTAPVDIIIEP